MWSSSSADLQWVPAPAFAGRSIGPVLSEVKRPRAGAVPHVGAGKHRRCRFEAPPEAPLDAAAASHPGAAFRGSHSAQPGALQGTAGQRRQALGLAGIGPSKAAHRAPLCPGEVASSRVPGKSREPRQRDCLCHRAAAAAGALSATVPEIAAAPEPGEVTLQSDSRGCQSRADRA